MAVIIGELAILAMIWHRSTIAEFHHRRADSEWSKLQEKLDILINRQAMRRRDDK
jgi:hypothetical protein